MNPQTDIATKPECATHQRLPKTTEGWLKLAAKHDEMREVLDILQPYAKEKYGMPPGVEDLVERALKPWRGGLSNVAIAPETNDLFGDLFGPEEDWTPNQRKAAEFARTLKSELGEHIAINDSLNTRLLAAEKRILELTTEIDEIGHTGGTSISRLDKAQQERNSALSRCQVMKEALEKARSVCAEHTRDICSCGACNVFFNIKIGINEALSSPPPSMILKSEHDKVVAELERLKSGLLEICHGGASSIMQTYLQWPQKAELLLQGEPSSYAMNLMNAHCEVKNQLSLENKNLKSQLAAAEADAGRLAKAYDNKMYWSQTSMPEEETSTQEMHNAITAHTARLASVEPLINQGSGCSEPVLPEYFSGEPDKHPQPMSKEGQLGCALAECIQKLNDCKAGTNVSAIQRVIDRAESVLCPPQNHIDPVEKKKLIAAGYEEYGFGMGITIAEPNKNLPPNC